MIQTLIPAVSVAEQVRDLIAQILADESVNQVALATAGAQDPTPYQFRVFTEREATWSAENLINQGPVVNVRHDLTTFSESSGTGAGRENASPAVYHIEVFHAGVAVDTVAGHDTGDQLANSHATRLGFLIRSILMADVYDYLTAHGTVYRRFIRDIASFRAQQDNTQAEHMAAVRLQIEVHFDEISPQLATRTAEIVFVNVKRLSDGQVLAQAEYDNT